MKKLVITSVITGLLLLIIFFSTDPHSAPSLLLIVPFILLLVFLFTITRLVLHFLGISEQRGKQIAVICAGIPTLLLILQSIGQLTVRDVVTIGLLVGLSYFYILRFTQKKTS